MSGVDSISGSLDYYALPNQSLKMVEDLLRARYEIGLEIMSPTRISSFSKRALREEKAAGEAIQAAKLEADRKLKKILGDDIKVRSSFSEQQEKYIKRVMKNHKLEMANLSSELELSQDKCTEAESELLRVKIENEKTVKSHNRDIVTMYSSGLQRITILSDAWHASNPIMCPHLLGFA